MTILGSTQILCKVASSHVKNALVCFVSDFRDDFWKANKYESWNIEMDSDSEGSEEEWGGDGDGEDEGQTTSRDIKYVIGDVTHPKETARKNNIVIHCAG